MESSAAQSTPVQSAQQTYQDAVRDIEQQFATTFSTVDGDYSRATQYAGLARDELLNIAKQRRVMSLEAARLTYENAIHAVAGTTPQAPEPTAPPPPAPEPLPQPEG